jgi:hypothetical protein
MSVDTSGSFWILTEQVLNPRETSKLEVKKYAMKAYGGVDI